jgi:hypothetical protein
MPVLPLVGSTIVVLPGLIAPFASASRIIDTPMRSFTLKPGVKDSSFATTVAPAPSVTRLRRTNGVLPINSVASLAIFGRTRRTRSSGLFTVLITLSSILRTRREPCGFCEINVALSINIVNNAARGIFLRRDPERDANVAT